MGSNRLSDRGETVRPVRRQSWWIGQSYSPESEISTEIRQDCCGHTRYYRTIQPLKTLNNAENLSPVNQRTNPEQAQDPPKAKPQTPQPETKRQVPTGAQFTQHPHRQTVPYSPQRHRQLQSKHHSSSIAHQMSPSEMRTSHIMPHILSAGSPDKESRCCDKLN